MVSLEQIAKWNAQVAEKQRKVYEKVAQIKANEDSHQTYKRKLMGLEWSEFPVLLEAKWHIDKCWYDGGRLKGADMGRIESAYIGGMDLGVGFLRYRLGMMEHSIHFEQCPKCKLLYMLPPSPSDLERLRKLKEAVYAGNREMGFAKVVKKIPNNL